jgi:hypothetical protein
MYLHEHDVLHLNCDVSNMFYEAGRFRLGFVSTNLPPFGEPTRAQKLMIGDERDEPEKASDVWSFAIIIYQLVTQQFVCSGRADRRAVKKLFAERAEDGELWQLLNLSVSDEPENRPTIFELFGGLSKAGFKILPDVETKEIRAWVSEFRPGVQPGENEVEGLERQLSEVNVELHRVCAERDGLRVELERVSAAFRAERDQLARRVAQLEAEVAALRPAPAAVQAAVLTALKPMLQDDEARIVASLFPKAKGLTFLCKMEKWNAGEFQLKVFGKSMTLFIFITVDGTIFGCFFSPEWGPKGDYTKDPGLKSLLFGVKNAVNAAPGVYKLKEANFAGFWSDNCLLFGLGADIHWGSGKFYDSADPFSYEAPKPGEFLPPWSAKKFNVIREVSIWQLIE